MKTLIIDDEKRQLDYLESKLEKWVLEISEIVKTQSPIEGLKLLRSTNFDLLFLDVEMPEMTGFELIEIIGADSLPPVIFTTAYSKYAVRAFKVNAIDYLLKPADPEELVRAVDRVQSERVAQKKSVDDLLNNLPSSEDDRLVIAQGQTYFFIQIEDIVHIQGSGSYSDFFLSDGRRLTVSKRLNLYWKRLTGKSFIRPHQSHIVNKQHIKGYSKSDGGSLILSGDHSIPISGKMREEIKKYLGL